MVLFVFSYFSPLFSLVFFVIFYLLVFVYLLIQSYNNLYTCVWLTGDIKSPRCLLKPSFMTVLIALA